MRAFVKQRQKLICSTTCVWLRVVFDTESVDTATKQMDP